MKMHVVTKTNQACNHYHVGMYVLQHFFFQRIIRNEIEKDVARLLKHTSYLITLLFVVAVVFFNVNK